MRLLAALIAFTAIVLISFAIWGDDLMQMFTLEGSMGWLRNYGPWAWLMSILLLITDLLLPLPATIIMAATGFLYGPVIGSLISIAGSFGSGSLAYWVCRSFGEGTTKKILGEKEFEKGRGIAERAGGWIVVLSRWLPVLPEVVACMAGLTRMNAIKFHVALLCGTIPMAVVYSIIGAQGNADPTIAIILSAGLPPVIWLIVSTVIKRIK